MKIESSATASESPFISSLKITKCFELPIENSQLKPEPSDDHCPIDSSKVHSNREAVSRLLIGAINSDHNYNKVTVNSTNHFTARVLTHVSLFPQTQDKSEPQVSKIPDKTSTKEITEPLSIIEGRRLETDSLISNLPSTVPSVVDKSSNIHPKEAVCQECDYKASHKSHLRSHIREVHMGLKPHACTECDYKASRKGHLRSHVNAVHQTVKPFAYSQLKHHACTECDYKTSQKGNLRSHTNAVHRRTKSYACSQCDYKSSFKPMVKRHVNSVHRRIKSHFCDECDYKASRKHSLQYHIRAIHPGVKPYACSECEYKAANKEILLKHIKYYHRESDSHDQNPNTSARHNSVQPRPLIYRTSRSSLSIQLLSKQQDSVQRMANQHQSVNASSPIYDIATVQQCSVGVELSTDRAQISYQCSDCMQRVETKLELERHIQSEHFMDCI